MNRIVVSVQARWVLAMLFSCTMVSILCAQGTKDDYERAHGLRDRFHDKVYRADVAPVWLEDAQRAWYRVQTGPLSAEFVMVDAALGSRALAFDHEKLASELGVLFEREFDARNLPIRSLEFDAAGRLIEMQCEGYEVRRSDSEAGWSRGEKVDTESQRRNRRGGSRGQRFPGPDLKSPDEKWEVEIRNHNVWLKEKDSDERMQLSFDGNDADKYIERCYWAPNSSRFVVVRRQDAQSHEVHLIESSPEDQLQPKLHTMEYLKPGDRVAIEKPQLFDVQSKARIPVSDALFDNPYHLRGYRWAPDSKEFYFLYNQRGHQVLRWLAIDGFTGSVRTVVDEVSETFIDYAYKQFSYYLDETDEAIWMSERDGWNHLYLYDLATGQVKNQMTSGNWVVRSVTHVDEAKRQLWFMAGGVYSDQDPYYTHACRINFDGSGFTVLTSANGTHDVSYSSDRRFLIATHSRVDSAPVTELRDGGDGHLIRVLETAELSDLEAEGWRAPERFSAKGRDGVTPIYGMILRPSNFDSARSYPVIEHIYAGPHGSHVPKSFRAYQSAQAVAELGFIVVRIDGMGTSNRSKAFHDVCWRNLKDGGFPDRILWMKAAAEVYPQLDLSRVGIYGGSAGGQNTVAALLHYPDFYKVGVADCGCHDNRMDKIWWNELWMGWPVGEHYADNSNVTHADKLEGKLFLTLGELDRNVDPASTMQLVDALVKADKEFDFKLIPGAGHGVGSYSPYLVRQRDDFFVRHLWGLEPRREVAPVRIPEDVRESFALGSFYRKYLDSDGFPIVSSDKVSDYALKEVDYLIDRMLGERSDIRSGLIELGFRFSVMAFDEYTTDIPEHSDLSPADFWDRRARGLGATRRRPSVSCGEENLLQFPGDPYNGESIMIHEFAHAIHEALRVIDDRFDDRLEAIYQAAMKEGRWKGKYAATNRYEYWAECVQSFYDDNRENDASHNHVDTREELAAYDPAIYELIRDTFRDNPWRYVPPVQREEPGHLAGFDRENAPRFEWPAHLVDALKKSRRETGERDVEIVEQDVEGWTVFVDIQLLEGFDEALGQKALALLRHQLFGIKLLMAPAVLEDLQRIGIRLDRDSKTLKGIQYHPSQRWLENHGHDPRLAKLVHIPQAEAFVSRSLSAVQPRVMLHELAHGYHDQFLGFDHAEIKSAYDSAKGSGRYDSVLHVRGHDTKHYALTDHKEYFAEGTEAYFGANDFYPYVRSELKQHDPGLFDLLERIWGKL